VFMFIVQVQLSNISSKTGRVRTGTFRSAICCRIQFDTRLQMQIIHNQCQHMNTKQKLGSSHSQMDFGRLDLPRNNHATTRLATHERAFDHFNIQQMNTVKFRSKFDESQHVKRWKCLDNGRCLVPRFFFVSSQPTPQQKNFCVKNDSLFATPQIEFNTCYV
jgi:hypothetical protein